MKRLILLMFLFTSFISNAGYIPPNAHVSVLGWACNKGYTKSGNYCFKEKQKIRPNAYASASGSYVSNLPDCKSSSSYWNNCFGTHTFAEGDKYVGEFKDDNFHGHGTYIYSSSGEWAGYTHTGKYKNNLRHGQGTMTYPDGDKYVGEWEYDKKHGQGTFTFGPSSEWAGDKYVGEFKDGKYHGQGTYTSADGRIHKGIWENGEFIRENISKLPDCKSSSSYWHNCFGNKAFSNGDKYVGEWMNGKQHGHGTYTYSSSGEWAGYIHTGKYKDDKRHGQGTMTYPDGDKYVGEFKDGKSHGQGTYTFAEGEKYVGEFKDDKSHGQGTYTFGPSSKWAGDKYVGEYKDDKRHGQGTYTFADGEKYVGEFKNGKYHGQGTYTFADGGNYVGKHKDGKAHGQGTYTWPSGSKYVGEWEYDKKHGQGTFTFGPSSEWAGDKYVGEFKDGKYHGQGTYTSADGRIHKGIWENGEFIRENISKLPDCKSSSSYWHNCFGNKAFSNGDKYVGEFKDNKGYGQGIFTYADGDKYVGEWMNGKQHGHGTYTYSSSGEWAGYIHTGKYKDDKRHGQGTMTYPDGDKYVGEFKDGKSHGQGTYTFADGEKYVGEFKNGKYHGQGTYTFADGGNYVGKHKDGKAHGQGTYTWPSGSKYVGEWKDDKSHGQGTYTFGPSSKWAGDKYVGEYKDDKRHGQGTYIFADGRIKKGIWENGEFLYANNPISNNKKLQDGNNAYDKKDYKTALSIYRSFAEQGNAEAQFSLGWMYKKGKGVTKSTEEAIEWYTKAAEQGYDIAQYNLGIVYIEGEGIPISYKKAFYWWSKSAKQGNPHSEYALGWLYEKGHGVKQNTKKALSWYLKADAKGNSKAKERIEELLLPKDDAPATVDENSTEGFTFAGSGSGFVVSKGGVIATNYHVIDGCNKIIIDDLKATVISKDIQNDLALLKVNNKYKYVSTLSYKSPLLGDNISVFGYPLSDMFSDDHISLTKGSVSSLSGFEGNLSNFRFTAAVQPGNSGGPVVNEEGRVVGITKSALGSKVLDKMKILPQNVNFGIRSNLLINMMESKLVGVSSDTLNKSDLINHYTRATKFIKCYE